MMTPERTKPERAITFIIPAYNAQGTLSRTIESILQQSDKRYQIIIVDDGSQDATAQIGKSYAAKYPKQIQYIFQENRRQGGARNTGLKMVQTEYVAFLDSDDWLTPDYVGHVLRQAEGAAEPPEIIMTLPVIYHEQSRAVRDWYDKELFAQVFQTDGDVVNPEEEQRIYQFEVNICRKVLNINFIRRTGFVFREKVKWEDVYPHFYLLSQCRCCMGVWIGFYYRIGEDTQTTAAGDSDRLDVLAVFEDLLQYIRQGREELIFPAMRIMLRFSFWCIHMADRETRKPLVQGIHAFFRRLPRRYIRILMRESIRQYCLADALQYGLLAVALRHRVCSMVFYDYLFQEICEKVIKKVLRADNRVA